MHTESIIFQIQMKEYFKHRILKPNCPYEGSAAQGNESDSLLFKERRLKSKQDFVLHLGYQLSRSGTKIATVAVCGGLGRKKLTHLVTAAVSLTHPGTPTVLSRRGCSQYKQVSSIEDLPTPMENPYKESLKKCILCGKHVNYKNAQLLSQFVSPFTGCIYGRHITGLCGKKQKEITKAIKRAQIMGFMPVTYKDPAYLKDPKVCNIRYQE
ncbi:small ribosomal subunit protein bS18m-like [Symphalangus syndactylus]|uniref:small ribosomal subunit protein bS18m-like n=1 Tax=Symphalangus syndactylus TaxID=9590 RepID=UPI0024426ECA|nr:28S ribosomal protein S18c, mitochondrial-like [Symphalangus syndactylus]